MPSIQGRWVVTGGLGSLGLLTAQWLAGQGRRHITLLGRSGRLEYIAQDRCRLNPALEVLQLPGLQKRPHPRPHCAAVFAVEHEHKSAVQALCLRRP